MLYRNKQITVVYSCQSNSPTRKHHLHRSLWSLHWEQDEQLTFPKWSMFEQLHTEDKIYTHDNTNEKLFSHPEWCVPIWVEYHSYSSARRRCIKIQADEN